MRWLERRRYNRSLQTGAHASGTNITVDGNTPADLDGDGLHEDINNDGDVGVADVQLLSDNISTLNENYSDLSALNFSGGDSSMVTQDDVEALFNIIYDDGKGDDGDDGVTQIMSAAEIVDKYKDEIPDDMAFSQAAMQDHKNKWYNPAKYEWLIKNVDGALEKHNKLIKEGIIDPIQQGNGESSDIDEEDLQEAIENADLGFSNKEFYPTADQLGLDEFPNQGKIGGSDSGSGGPPPGAARLDKARQSPSDGDSSSGGLLSSIEGTNPLLLAAGATVLGGGIAYALQ